MIFSKLFYCSSRRQQKLSKTLGTFFVWFWTLLVLQSHGVLLPGAAFFEAVLPASAAAAAATSSASSRRQQKLFFQDFRRHVRIPVEIPWVGLGWSILQCAPVFVYKMAFSSLQNGMATNSTTKWLFPAYKMVWHKLDSTKWCSFVNYIGPFFSTKKMIFSSTNCQTIAFILQEKLQGHFVELPPCPELSSKGNFSIAILQGFYPVTRSFSISPKIDKKCFSIFARGQTVPFFSKQYADILETN